MLLPYALFILIAVALHFKAPMQLANNKDHQNGIASSDNYRPLLCAGFLLGVGIGGFIDGILFHQILQSHNMLSNIIFPNTVVSIDINMFWDGIFHTANLIIVFIALTLLWHAIRREDIPKSTDHLIGSGLCGFGTFNLIEGLLNHHIFQLHHVIQRALPPYQGYWDIAFLGSGIIFIIIGVYIIKKPLKDT